MKTTILIIDGEGQIALTPETEGDKAALKIFEELSAAGCVATTMRGSFVETNGGWIQLRPVDTTRGNYAAYTLSDNSLMVRFRRPHED